MFSQPLIGIAAICQLPLGSLTIVNTGLDLNMDSSPYIISPLAPSPSLPRKAYFTLLLILLKPAVQ